MRYGYVKRNQPVLLHNAGQSICLLFVCLLLLKKGTSPWQFPTILFSCPPFFLPPSSAQFMNKCSYNSTSPICLHGADVDNFTFFLWDRDS